jgi:hypothetical protein
VVDHTSILRFASYGLFPLRFGNQCHAESSAFFYFHMDAEIQTKIHNLINQKEEVVLLRYLAPYPTL